jgi:hypothetical protein
MDLSSLKQWMDNELVKSDTRTSLIILSDFLSYFIFLSEKQSSSSQ